LLHFLDEKEREPSHYGEKVPLEKRRVFGNRCKTDNSSYCTSLTFCSRNSRSGVEIETCNLIVERGKQPWRREDTSLCCPTPLCFPREFCLEKPTVRLWLLFIGKFSRRRPRFVLLRKSPNAILLLNQLSNCCACFQTSSSRPPLHNTPSSVLGRYVTSFYRFLQKRGENNKITPVSHTTLSWGEQAL
jgi:hypothetical protein